MWQSARLLLILSLPGSFLLSSCSQEHRAARPSTPSLSSAGTKALGDLHYEGNNRLFVSCVSLLAERLPADKPWQPGIFRSRTRGAETLYERVAPSVVIVRTAAGHGTGFVIDAEKRMVLTNYHVVHAGTSIDSERQASLATVNLGKLDAEGYMRLVEPAVPAVVLEVDRVRDLALLQLLELPPDMDRLAEIPLGESAIPGTSCAILGHPSSGFPWTYREGNIAAAGDSPRDLVNFLMPLLASENEHRQQMETELDTQHSVRVLLSNCEANPGDSGGPLVSQDGHLVGVTFAIPGEAAEQKFTYHIALSEVRSFLDAADETPVLLVPDAWEIGSMVAFVEPYLLMASTHQGRQLLFDLDHDTPNDLLESMDLQQLIGERRFDIEVALHFSTDRRLAFYDTNNDGTMDVVLDDFDEDMTADRRFVLNDQGSWSVTSDIDVEQIDPALLLDSTVRDSFAAKLQQLEQRQQASR